MFVRFLEDMVLHGGVEIISLASEDLGEVTTAATRFGLDFDDASQYVAAKARGLTVVSFDADFDKTDLRRATPMDTLGN